MSNKYLRVFLSYGSEDRSAVREIYSKLREDGVKPWFDEKELLPGQDWNLEIRQAARSSDAILVCLSSRSVRKEGYIQKEIKLALDIAEEKPDGTIFIIPVKLDSCELPLRLQNWQWVDWGNVDAYDKVLRALRARAAECSVDHLPGAGPLVQIVRPFDSLSARLIYRAADLRDLIHKNQDGQLTSDDVPVLPLEQVAAITDEALTEILSRFQSDERRAEEKEKLLALIGIHSPYREWQEVNTKNHCFRNDSDFEEIQNVIQRVSVRSSNVSSIGYDAQTKILEVEFHSSSIYHYFSVPEHLFHGLLSASSHGKYLNDYIKSSYAYHQIQ
ncbi:MAG: TIR domain-containing protein [Nostoc sp.]